MKRNALTIILFLLINTLSAQVFWTETFDGMPCAANSGCDPSIVGWSVTNVGTNGGAANTWYVSCAENGNPANQCGSGCQGGPNGDQSLHVGNVSTSTAAFIFCPSGDCGAAYDDSSPAEITSKRAESPVINCTGQTNIICSFVYIETGENQDDDASFWYFDGTVWTQLDPIAKTNNTGCGGQGRWTNYTVNLPASANNNPNVRIGFLWVNDGDGAATDPSFAVDDITLASNTTTPPVASFTASQTTICVNDCINFTNTSTGGPFTSVSWTFTGATPSSSTQDSPSNICYPAAGTYNVTLTVTNANGSNSTSQTITVNPCTGPPTALFTANPTTVCAGSTVQFTDQSTGAPTSWNWTFPGGTPASSTAQNPIVTYNNPGTYSVTLTVTNGNGSNTATQTNYITVINCVPPQSSFSIDDSTICAGQCITLTNNSVGAISYSWSFPGGTPASSTSQNPGTICYPNDGTYTITLTVTNPNGSSTSTHTVIVSQGVTVFANNDTLIDSGQSVDLFALGTPPGGTYNWSPATGLTCTNCANPTAYPQTSTDYIVTYTNNGCSASDTVRIFVNIIEDIDVPNAFSPNGDNINDVLFVKGNGIFSFKLIIYNRYGQKVFETNAQNIGWDGKHNGKDVDPGVFAWYLEYVMISGKTGAKKGNVTLIR
jgi:gliding motility-associated-like protein